MTLSLAKTLRSSLMSAWPLILCLAILVTLSLLSLALAAHWLAPPPHLPTALRVIPHPWGCGGSPGPC